MSTIIPFPVASPAMRPDPSRKEPPILWALSQLTEQRVTNHSGVGGVNAMSQSSRELLSAELEAIVLDLERKADALRRCSDPASALALARAAEIIEMVSKQMELP